MCVSDGFAFTAFFDLSDRVCELTPPKSVTHAARHMANVKQHICFLGECSRQFNASLRPTSVSDGARLMLVCFVNMQCCANEQ